MTPYASFLYFAVAGFYALLPATILRACFRTIPPWITRSCIVAATAVMLAIQYSNVLDDQTPGLIHQLEMLGAFALAQYLIAATLISIRRKTKSRWPGYAAILLSLSPLAAAKFTNVGGIVEFVGLSYATLRAIDVLVGIHDGLIKSLPAGQFFAFLVFFPTISSGPIDRWRRFSVDWERTSSRADFLDDLDQAVHHIFTGFLYKFILAYLIKTQWLDKISAIPTLRHDISYMYAYSAYLFFDFAGYSAFAIGFSYLFGVRTPENFNKPFLSRNIKEFWTRWHITLSYWFRDFIYMRFLLAAIKGKWFRSKYTAAYVANFLTFGAMGLWHGTARHYLIYGVYHACLVTGHDLFARWNKPHPDQPARWWGDSRLAQFAAALVTIHAVCFGFLIFSGRRLF